MEEIDKELIKKIEEGKKKLLDAEKVKQRKIIFEKFYKLTSSLVYEYETAAIFYYFLGDNNNTYYKNDYIKNLLEESDKNTLVALKSINRFGNLHRIRFEDVITVFYEYINSIKPETN
jgi:hypothetical protein